MNNLFEEQLQHWSAAALNYKDLEKVSKREFEFNGFKIQVVYNPGRVRSSTAKVDKQSIKQRPCFLCSKNRPKEQSFLVRGDYEILVNPFPIAHPHFTIAHTLHIPQLIQAHIDDLLSIASSYPQFAFFYNGAKCGASAPDHLHFQAVYPEALPIVQDWDLMREEKACILQTTLNYTISTLKDYLRTVIVVEASSSSYLKEGMDSVINSYKEGIEEPAFNVIIHYTQDKRRAFFFPRKQLRPWQYFETGEKRLLISPGSIEMAGVLITPYEEDFERITKYDIESIYEQVSAPLPKKFKCYEK